MPAYEYKARDSSAREFAGTYDDVQSVAALRLELGKMGCTLLRARRKKAKAARQSRIKSGEVITFVYQLAGMSSAGLPIVKSLDALESQAENDAFRLVIADIRNAIEKGSGLRVAFEKHGKLFSDFFIGMLDAAETGGRLGESLEISASYLEKQADLKQKVISVFAYPVIVGIMTVLAVTGLLIFVVPVFEKIYRQAGMSLPMPTRVLIMLSSALCDAWWAIIPLVGVLAYGIKYMLKNPQFRCQWDSFKLNMPVLGKLNKMVAVSRFVRTFAMLVSTGVSLVRALEVASVVAGNARLAEIAVGMQTSIRDGRPVAESMKGYDIFPPMVVEMAASGEEAGRLADMLNKGVDFVDKEIDRTIKSLLVKLEPALTIMLGGVVGFVLLGIYLPLFDYMGQAH